MTDASVPPLVIAVAPNGARRGKADHPRLPLTLDEIAHEAARCREAGAAMLHLHVRDAEGRHVLDAGLYRETIAAVRCAAGADFLIQITTEAVGRYAPPSRWLSSTPSRRRRYRWRCANSRLRMRISDRSRRSCSVTRGAAR